MLPYTKTKVNKNGNKDKIEPQHIYLECQSVSCYMDNHHHIFMTFVVPSPSVVNNILQNQSWEGESIAPGGGGGGGGATPIIDPILVTFMEM